MVDFVVDYLGCWFGVVVWDEDCFDLWFDQDLGVVFFDQCLGMVWIYDFDEVWVEVVGFGW